MYFEREKNEETIEEIRKSVFTILPSILKVFSLSLPAVFTLLYYDYPLFSLLALAWIVIMMSYLLHSWLIWYFSVYMITTNRVIEVSYSSLFSKEITELSFNKIEDVNYSVEGFGASLFSYGTVKISPHSAISTVRMNLINVSEPQNVKELILELRARTRTSPQK